MKKILLSALFVLAVPFASATVFTQGSASTDSGYNADFDVSTFMFAPELVNTITVANAVFGYAHSHGDSTDQTLEVYDGANWNIVNQFTLNTDGTDAYLADIFSNPVTFTGQLISGLRLSETNLVGYTYHNIDQNMTFTTSDTGSVPEPTTVALLGLGLLGFAIARRKSAK